MLPAGQRVSFVPCRSAPGIVSNSQELWIVRLTLQTSLHSSSACLTTAYALMSSGFPKRSARKILERIIPPPSGGRDYLHFIRSQRVSLSASVIKYRLTLLPVMFKYGQLRGSKTAKKKVELNIIKVQGLSVTFFRVLQILIPSG